jgi:hypothetical protein
VLAAGEFWSLHDFDDDSFEKLVDLKHPAATDTSFL